MQASNNVCAPREGEQTLQGNIEYRVISRGKQLRKDPSSFP